ncbi:MAG: hypothetical protein GXY55_15505 [Phycisphaerae bacterium]|nr:hypothetical protein [Phycisphaerae bacterium]
MSLFPPYVTGENRVTASILAVLKSLAMSRIERLLGALLEQSEFELVRFQNQPASGGKGVPDAMILSSCYLLLETKTQRNSIKAPDQLMRHLRRLDKSGEHTRLLLLLTPDQHRPPVCDRIKDERLIWASFSAFHQSIEELLADKYEVISEREAFLLRELQSMFVEERLIGSPNDVLVVPARRAWPMYTDFHVYVCQPRRPFQPVTRISFYCDGQIQPLVPTILEVHEEIMLTKDANDGEVRDRVNALLRAGKVSEGQSAKIMLLSAPDDPRTVRLPQPIPNDLESSGGRGIAFTQNQRYVALADLKTARTTSGLVSHT